MTKRLASPSHRAEPAPASHHPDETVCAPGPIASGLNADRAFEKENQTRFKCWKWLNVGLTTLVASGLVWGGLISVATADKPAPLKYTWTPLPGGNCSMNKHGDVVGSAVLSDGTTHLVIWVAEQEPVVLDTLMKGLDEALPYVDRGLQFFSSNALINDNGQITGLCTYKKEGADREWQHVFFYDPEGDGQDVPRFVVLPEPPEDPDLLWSSPRAMNNLGLIVGYSVCPAAADKVYSEVAVAWDPQTGTAQKLQVPGLNLNAAAAVNDFGQVVCNSGLLTDTGDRRAVIYDYLSGEYEILQPLGAYDALPFTTGNGINTFGEVVGTTTTKTGRFAYTYTATGGMVNLGSIQAKWYSSALAVNDVGQVVGDVNGIVNGYVNQYIAFLYTPATGMLDLWSLILNPPAGMVKGGTVVRKIYNPNSGRAFGQILISTSAGYYVLTPNQ